MSDDDFLAALEACTLDPAAFRTTGLVLIVLSGIASIVVGLA